MSQPSLLTAEQLTRLRRIANDAPTVAPWVELGVYEGGSATVLYEVAERRGAKLHLFDTFNGQPTYESSCDPHKFGQLRSELDEYDARHLMPHAEVHVGVFPEILDYCDHLLRDVAFVHVDFACYAGTYEAARIFAPRLIVGGVMVFSGASENEAVAAAMKEAGMPPGPIFRRRTADPIPVGDAMTTNRFAMYRKHTTKKIAARPRRTGGGNDVAA